MSSDTPPKKAGNQRAAGDYDVGYGKPPKDTRFKKGQSGNPSGRRTRNQNLGAMIGKTLFDEVQLADGSKAPRIDLVAKRLVKKAIEGDMQAIRLALRLADTLSPMQQMIELEDPASLSERRALSAKLVEALEHMASEKKKKAPRIRFGDDGKLLSPSDDPGAGEASEI